jgi:outer membrane protein assembly factor BamE (lipoprotein component of BamABCDE complex)
MNSRSIVLAVLLSAAMPACYITRSTTNEPITRASIDKLVPGTSTAQEVVATLGAPAEVVQLGTRTAYRYEFVNTKRAVLFLVVLGFYNEDTRADRAWLFFDSQNVLTHVGATLEADRAEYAMPWWDVHGK